MSERPGDEGDHLITTTKEAVRCAKQSGETKRSAVTCPKCGEEYRNLPKHLVACSGGESS